MKDCNFKTAVQVLNYFINNEPDKKINKLKVLKLIWLADRYHLRKYGRPIFRDNYFAMKMGPVASKIKDIIDYKRLTDEEISYRDKYLGKLINNYFLESSNKFDSSLFSETDIEVLCLINDKFGKMPYERLSKLSHQYPEWKKWERKINETNKRILMNYKDFFLNNKEIANDFFLTTNDDLVKINQEMHHL